MNRIAKVEDDYNEMMELKKRAEAADVAKSQVFGISILLIFLGFMHYGMQYSVTFNFL
jgi:hypothetical protein